MSGKRNKIQYNQEIPDVVTIVEFFNDSGYFPIKDKSDRDRIQKMFENANLVVTAWDGEKLVGISRSISDFCYCCYLSDLAVRNGYKGKGIGKRMVEMTKELAGDQCKLILQSSPDAMGFYRKIGMEQIDSAYIAQRKK